MSTAYDIRRARREKERQRAALGETLQDYHDRERATQGRPGASLSRKRCALTPSLFDGHTDRETRTGILDLFANLFR